MRISNILFPETDQHCIFPSPESVKPDLAAEHNWIPHHYRPIQLRETTHSTYIRAGTRMIHRNDLGRLSAADIDEILYTLNNGLPADPKIFTVKLFRE